MVDKTPEDGAKKPTEETKKIELVTTTKQIPTEPVQIPDKTEGEETKDENKQ